MALVSFIIFLNNYGSLQLMASVLLNVLQVAYLGNIRPMPSRYSNALEFFNDTMVMFTSANMFIFTDFVPSSEMRFWQGWVMLG